MACHRVLELLWPLLSGWVHWCLLCYDILTFPMFSVMCREKKEYMSRTHAKKEDEGEEWVHFSSTVQPNHVCSEIERLDLKTITDCFNHAWSKHAALPALGTRVVLSVSASSAGSKYELGDYQWLSYAQMRSRSEILGVNLRLKLGLMPTSRLALLAETRAEWMITAAACFLNNLTIVTLYPNLGVDGLRSALDETGVEVIVTSMESLSKVGRLVEKCSRLRSVLLMPFRSSEERERARELGNQMEGINVLLMEDFFDLKENKDIAETERVVVRESDTAIIMYTSGSTDCPKGVVLSHRNLVSAIKACVNFCDFKSNDRIMPLLPLAHVLELVAETSSLIFGMPMAYSSPTTLTDSSPRLKSGCRGDALLHRPTVLCAVPMLLDRISAAIKKGVASKGFLATKVFEVVLQYKTRWSKQGYSTPLLDAFMLKGMLGDFLGGQIRLVTTGGAPLSDATHTFVSNVMNVPVLQGYGATETTSAVTMTEAEDRATGRVGRPLYGVHIKLVDWKEGEYRVKDRPWPRGEIHVAGANVAEMYFNNEEETNNAFYVDQQGVRWFCTGDIGQMEDNGVLRIIDRKKDLIKLQHGEYVSLGRIESILKSCHITHNICLVAKSSMSYVVAIVVVDPNTLDLTDSRLQDEHDLCDEDVQRRVVLALRDHGLKHGLNKFELPRKVVLSLEDWTPDAGLVTASLKIKRKAILQRFQKQIDQIYY